MTTQTMNDLASCGDKGLVRPAFELDDLHEVRRLRAGRGDRPASGHTVSVFTAAPVCKSSLYIDV